MRSNLLKTILMGSLLAASCGLQPGDTTYKNGMFGFATSARYQAYSTQANEVAIARVTASSERSSHFPVSMVTDGNLGTAWGPSESDAMPRLTFELNGVQALTGFGIKKSPEGITVDVEVSDNGRDWEVVEEGLTPATATMDWIDLPYVETRFVRLTFHGSTGELLVCEVKFYGEFNEEPWPSPTPWPTATPRVPGLGVSPSPTPIVSPSPVVNPSPTPPATSSPTPTPMPSTRPTPTPPPEDEDCGCDVTGGGFILNGNKKVTFGFVAHHNPALGPSGNIQVVDHATKARFHGRVNAVECEGDTVTFSGTLRGGGTFTTVVTDVTEPGRKDTFSFSTSLGVDLEGELGGDRPGGGNIQLHKKRCD